LPEALINWPHALSRTHFGSSNVQRVSRSLPSQRFVFVMAMITRRLRQLRKLAKVLASGDYLKAFARGGVAAAIEHEPLLKSLRFQTVIDIGANRGQFALMTRHCLPEARIIAFEPLAEPARRFRAVLGEDPLVTLHQVAIGPALSTARMHVTAEDDSSSLLPVTTRLQTLHGGTREVASEMIDVAPLDARVAAADLAAPALLKIDVQGYELPALEGCAALLSGFSHVYVECSFVELYEGQALAGEVIDYLRAHGFNLVGVYNLQYDSRGQALQADILFATATK
jgi:FkbM family methyltransferase